MNAAPEPGSPQRGPSSGYTQLEYVLAALQTLPDRWQQVLWYTDVLGEKPQEIAPRMGITPAAVSSLTYRAHAGLNKALTNHPSTLTNPCPNRADTP